MVVKNLTFFDNNGYDLNFEWNDDLNVWEGNIYLPKVSVGLYANTNIYVMEKIEESSSESENSTKYYFPQKNGNDTKIMFRWDLSNDYVDEFFMFTFDELYYGTHEIDTSSLTYTPNDGPELETLIVNKFDEYDVELDDTFSQKALPIHIAFSSPEKYDATTFKRTLNMFYGYTMIAKITFFAETVEEDERLKVLTNNLGYNIKQDDTIIFKESDIKECYPNYQLINEKRKEILIEGHNIYPYIGSYKAIINAIKYFGYENLNIVEYWRNVDTTSEYFGKLFATTKYSLTNKETISVKGTSIPIPNRKYRKTNEIALVYTINHPTEEVDELEIPLVEEDFTYTIEEAIIKLYALRRKLNKEFMPSSSRIVDIIGEGSYFGLDEIVNNAVVPEHETTFEPKKHFFGSFSAFPSTHIHITDNRPYRQYAIEEFWKDFADATDTEDDEVERFNISTPLSSIASSKISDLGKPYLDTFNSIPEVGEMSKVSYYEEYYNKIHEDNELDETFEPNDHTLLAGEIEPTAKVILSNTSFDDILFGDVPDKFNSQYISDMTFYSIGYRYYGYKYITWTLTFSENQKDDELENVGVDKTYDTKTYKHSICGDVDEFSKVMFELPYVGYYDVKIRFSNTIDGSDSDSDSDSESKTYIFKKGVKVEPYSIDIRGFYYDARELPESISYDMESVTETIGDTDGSESDTTNDYLDFIERTLIDMTNGALIGNYDDSDMYKTLPRYAVDGSTINYGPFKHNYLNSDWYLYDNINEDIEKLEPNIEYARYIKSGVNVKPYTWFLLGIDMTKITSVRNIHWKLINIGNGECIEHDGRYLTYLLKKEGDYRVEVSLSDSHGNKYTMNRNIIVVDNDANYEMYQLFKNDYEAYKEEKDARTYKLYQDFAKLNTSFN